MDLQGNRAERFAQLREQARAGANGTTFRGYENLWREARAAGDETIARQCLRDLAQLTAQIDPNVGRELAQAAGGVAPRGTPDLSVIVVGAPISAGEPPALRAIAAQTLPAARFEVIVADASGSASRNEGLRAATGRIVLFMDPDVAPAPDAFERLLAAHSAAQPRVVAGRIDGGDLTRLPLPRLLERIGLASSLSDFTQSGEISGELCDAGFLSAPREALLRAGGFDPELTCFDGADLGVRLTSDGATCWFDPSIVATRPVDSDLDSWLRRARAMGADWFRLRAKHGADAPPSFLRGIGLEAAAAESILSTLLTQSDVQERCTASLRESLREFAAVAAKPSDRGDLFALVQGDFSDLLLRVTRHELMRGFVNAANGGTRESLETCTAKLAHGAAVLVLNDPAGLAATKVVLQHLPADAQLVVACAATAPVDALPNDRRLVKMRIPAVATSEQTRNALLGATTADFFVLLDGSCAPTAADWNALRLTLGTVPCIGACNVEGDGEGPVAKAKLSARLGGDLVAVRRDVIASDPGEAGPLLERLVRRGYRLATARPGLVACG